MKKHIPYDELEELLRKKRVYRAKTSRKKRVPYPIKTLLDAFLQAWYGLMFHYRRDDTR
jgi:hypothetical protein